MLRILSVVAFLLLATSMLAQTGDKQQLKQQYDVLLEEIRKTEEVLAETKKNRQASVGELEALQRKIDIRRQLIGNISDQISGLNSKINETTTVILSMERDLEDLKEEYAKMVRHAYMTQGQDDKLAFVFSSENFAEAYRKTEYLKQYTSFRKEQIKLIKDVQTSLAAEVEGLELIKEEKNVLLAEEQEQRSTLDRERTEQNSKIQTLENIESKLLSAINDKRRDAEQLNKRIESIIAEEIRKERLRALESANSEGANTGSRGDAVPTLTPEMKLISSQFSGNKGRLPWPVEQGVIAVGFGRHLHPILRNPPVYIQSNGLDISTNRGSAVRSIFDGEVVNIIFNPSFQRGVIIKHGEYFTVYTKLTNVNVKPGDKVQSKQIIGTAYTDDEENKTEVHLEIWRGTTLLDPQEWISR
jgi:septal ring factor EnvC (AmiA/AmiB activator)